MSHLVNVPKLRVPFSITGSRAEVVEQDGDEEITQCVEAIIKTPIGSRVEEPNLGIPDFAFTPSGTDLDEIEDAIEDWEPRAAFTLSEDEIEDMVLRVNIDVQQREEDRDRDE